MLVRPDGAIEIEWIDPAATDLVLAVGSGSAASRPFPVKVIAGRLYCG